MSWIDTAGFVTLVVMVTAFTILTTIYFFLWLALQLRRLKREDKDNHPIRPTQEASS